MPSSDPAQIQRVLDVVRSLNPRSILDVGPGMGKYGLLFREYLELWGAEPTGVQRREWRRRIDAVEAFAPYHTPLLAEIYDAVHLCDALSFLAIPSSETWDMIFSCDQIEHIAEADVPRFIDAARARCRWLLVVTPKFPSEQGEVFGNPYETHRSKLIPADLPGGSVVESVADAWLCLVPGRVPA